MSNFRKSMADDLYASGAKSDDKTACALALLSLGWRAIHVAAWLDDAIVIFKNMARSSDALPDESGYQVTSSAYDGCCLLTYPRRIRLFGAGLFGEVL